MKNIKITFICILVLCLIQSISTQVPCNNNVTIAFVIDTSGSIVNPSFGGHPNNEFIIKDTLKMCVDAFRDTNREIAIYTFSGQAEEVFDYQKFTDQPGIDAAYDDIDDIEFGGFTNTQDAEKIVRVNRPDPLGPDFVIMFTDGDPTTQNNDGPYTGLTPLAAAIAEYSDLIAGANTVQRIVATGTIDEVNVQSLSGPTEGEDYFFIEDVGDLKYLLQIALNDTCCDEERDECGVCFGDGSSCVCAAGTCLEGIEVFTDIHDNYCITYNFNGDSECDLSHFFLNIPSCVQPQYIFGGNCTEGFNQTVGDCGVNENIENSLEIDVDQECGFAATVCMPGSIYIYDGAIGLHGDDHCATCITDAFGCPECESGIFDHCGICNGDNSTCTDCFGIPFGDAVFDECGVCDGDGSTCEGFGENCPPITNLTIVELTRFNLDLLDCGEYEFIVTINFIPDTIPLISFHPWDGYCTLDNRGTCSNVADGVITDAGGYCDVFSTTDINFDDQAELYFESGGWLAYLHTENSTVTLRRSFNLTDLILCEDDTNNLVIDTEVIGDTTIYSGTVYITLVDLDDDNCTSPETCDIALFSQPYSFEISITVDDIIGVEVFTSELDFHFVRIYDEWLPSGDVVVQIQSLIKHIEQAFPGDQSTRLVDVFIDVGEETGIPMEVLTFTADCTEDNTDSDEYCEQYWAIGTDGVGPNIFDFSGIKPLIFTVEVNGINRQIIRVDLHLDLSRGDNPINNIEEEVYTEITLWRDRDLTIPYDSGSEVNNTFIDCELVCVLVEFICQDSEQSAFNIPIDLLSATICGSDSGDMIPPLTGQYDITGCNTPFPDTIAYVLFDMQFEFINDVFNVEILEHLDLPESQMAFCYETVTFNDPEFNQLILIDIGLDFPGGGDPPIIARNSKKSLSPSAKKTLQDQRTNERIKVSRNAYISDPYKGVHYPGTRDTQYERHGFFSNYDHYGGGGYCGYRGGYTSCKDNHVYHRGSRTCGRKPPVCKSWGWRCWNWSHFWIAVLIFLLIIACIVCGWWYYTDYTPWGESGNIHHNHTTNINTSNSHNNKSFNQQSNTSNIKTTNVNKSSQQNINRRKIKKTSNSWYCKQCSMYHNHHHNAPELYGCRRIYQPSRGSGNYTPDRNRVYNIQPKTNTYQKQYTNNNTQNKNPQYNNISTQSYQNRFVSSKIESNKEENN